LKYVLISQDAIINLNLQPVIDRVPGIPSTFHDDGEFPGYLFVSYAIDAGSLQLRPEGKPFGGQILA
jgi:hypothetical protein